MPNYKFSGHETFPCRYAWLPKAVGAIQREREIFSQEEGAIVELGVGKNMVKAIRFWMQAMGIAELTADGLWLIHWKLLSHVEDPLFAWDYLINRWTRPDINRAEVIRTFEQESKRIDRKLSQVTLEQHFDVFLHTYISTRSRKGDIQEDSLDCPLVELELIECIGERNIGGSERREPVYAFRREPKPDITPELFIYCLYDYWSKRRPNEATLTFRDVSVAHGSLGQVFKLPEADIRERLEHLKDDSNSVFSYQESAALQKLSCPNRHDISEPDLITAIYHSDDAGEYSESYMPVPFKLDDGDLGASSHNLFTTHGEGAYD